MFHSPKEIKETCMTYKDIKQSKMKKELILYREKMMTSKKLKYLKNNKEQK